MYNVILKYHHVMKKNHVVTCTLNNQHVMLKYRHIYNDDHPHKAGRSMLNGIAS